MYKGAQSGNELGPQPSPVYSHWGLAFQEAYSPVEREVGPALFLCTQWGTCHLCRREVSAETSGL